MVHSLQRTARVRIEQNGEEIACLLWTDQDKQSAFHSTRAAILAKLKAILVRAIFIDCGELLKQPAIPSSTQYVYSNVAKQSTLNLASRRTNFVLIVSVLPFIVLAKCLQEKSIYNTSSLRLNDLLPVPHR